MLSPNCNKIITGNNLFHSAILAENKSKDLLKLFLNYCNKNHLLDSLSSINFRQCTVLHLACYSRNLECIKLLLKIQQPIGCFVIKNHIIKDHYKNFEDEQSSETSSDSKKVSITNSSELNANKIGTRKSSSSIDLEDKNLIAFNKQQINLLDEDELFKGGTPLHWCNNDKKFIGELLQMGFIKYLNVRNINQETALHVAVRRGNFRSALIFFCTGEKLNQTGDSIGNTPLHIAVNFGNLNLVKLLTVFGDEDNLNSKNNLGLTPRHLAAQNPSKSHSQILYALDILGAKRCEKDSETDSTNQILCNEGCSKLGNYNGLNIYNFQDNDNECWYTNFVLKRIGKNLQDRKLLKRKKSNFDLASRQILKTCLNLVRFKSKEKMTAREKISQLEKKIKSLEKIDGNNKSTDEITDKILDRKQRILSIDGGGVKGIFAVQTLIELEKRLKYPLGCYFNWFAGTSTGSFIATLISLNYKLVDIRTMYFVLKNKVFQNYLPHDEEMLESYLRKYLGERTMNKVPNCKLTVTSSLYDRLPVQLHLFRNYPSPNELLNKPLPKARLDNKDKTYKEIPNFKEQVLWKALRASSSAPIYFNSFGSFCDGGLISNSPVIDLLTEHFLYNELYDEIGEANKKQELDFILSIGCGQNNITLNEYIYDFSSYSRVDRFLKYVINAKPLSTLFISELNNTEHHKQLRTMAWCKSMNIPYVRISPFLDGKVKLDERKDEIIVDGLWKCKAHFYQKKELIDNLVNLLEADRADKSRLRMDVPRVELNYKTDFDDDTKVARKEMKRLKDLTNEELIDEVKKQNQAEDILNNI